MEVINSIPYCNKVIEKYEYLCISYGFDIRNLKKPKKYLYSYQIQTFFVELFYFQKFSKSLKMYSTVHKIDGYVSESLKDYFVEVLKIYASYTKAIYNFFYNKKIGDFKFLISIKNV